MSRLCKNVQNETQIFLTEKTWKIRTGLHLRQCQVQLLENSLLKGQPLEACDREILKFQHVHLHAKVMTDENKKPTSWWGQAKRYATLLKNLQTFHASVAVIVLKPQSNYSTL